MALPFQSASSRKKRKQYMAVDLGGRTTKAVLIEARGDSYVLSRFAVLDAPIYDKKSYVEVLGGHLKAVSEAMGNSCKQVTLAVGLDDAIVRPVEMPMIPVNEMRLILKNNTKTYLQQDLPNHTFDCYIFPPKAPAGGKGAEASKVGTITKLKILAAAARQQLVNELQAAAKAAGLAVDAIVPGIIGPVNALEFAKPEVFANDSVALVDIGFKHTSVSILDKGELILTRMINIGGDKITAGLAETMSISYAEAEGIKIGMAGEVQAALELLVIPLGREVRASLDFFEHQFDRPISQILVSGATAQSEIIRQIVHAELMIECKTWNPVSFLQLALQGQQAVEIEHAAPQLTVAIGATLAV